MTFHEQDSKIKAKKKRQAVPCIEKSTGQDKGEIAMKILNGKVFENGKFVEKEVATDGSFFAADSGDGKEIDAAGCYVIPGLIDIHFHGCAGVDFCDGTVEAMRHMAEYELQNGITSIHPATMTLSEEELTTISKAAKTFHEETESG